MLVYSRVSNTLVMLLTNTIEGTGAPGIIADTDAIYHHIACKLWTDLEYRQIRTIHLFFNPGAADKLISRSLEVLCKCLPRRCKTIVVHVYGKITKHKPWTKRIDTSAESIQAANVSIKFDGSRRVGFNVNEDNTLYVYYKKHPIYDNKYVLFMRRWIHEEWFFNRSEADEKCYDNYNVYEETSKGDIWYDIVDYKLDTITMRSQYNGVARGL